MLKEVLETPDEACELFIHAIVESPDPAVRRIALSVSYRRHHPHPTSVFLSHSVVATLSYATARFMYGVWCSIL